MKTQHLPQMKEGQPLSNSRTKDDWYLKPSKENQSGTNAQDTVFSRDCITQIPCDSDVVLT